MKDFERDKSGKPEPTNPDNLRFLFRGLGLELRWNAWTEQIEIKGGSQFTPNLKWAEWTKLDDTIAAQIRTHARRTQTKLNMGKDFFLDTTVAFSRNNAFDPLLEKIDKLEHEWDGEPRLDRWLTETCGTPDDKYHRAVARIIIGGIVMRARKPGCKFDFMPIFYGKQGTLKSTMARVLALEDKWFEDSTLLGTEAKELVLTLAGKLVVEVSEMGSKSTVNVNHVKAMLSRQVDRGRAAYDRIVRDRPRRNVFFGTTNDSAPLSDPTGNRRFLPIAVKSEINLKWLRENIEQLYAEAANAEAAGDTFELPRDVWEAAGIAQDAVREVPEWRIYFEEWFAKTELDVFVTAADLADFARAAGYPRAVKRSEYLALMTELGFAEHTKKVSGKSVKVYFRGDHIGATRIIPRKDNNGRMTAVVSVEADPQPMPGQAQHLPA